MKLYYSKGACSLVPRIIINELRLPVEYEAVNLKTKQTESGKDYFQINPKGAVPALQLDNGEILTENLVIHQYLADNADTKQLLPPVGDFKRYRVLEWSNYITTELHKGFGPMFNSAVSQEIKDQIFVPLLQSKLSYIEKSLHNKKYLLGDDFTLPDPYLFVMLRWASHFQFDLKKWPHLNQYYDLLTKRPAIQKSLTEEGL